MACTPKAPRIINTHVSKGFIGHVNTTRLLKHLALKTTRIKEKLRNLHAKSTHQCERDLGTNLHIYWAKSTTNTTLIIHQLGFCFTTFPFSHFTT